MKSKKAAPKQPPPLVLTPEQLAITLIGAYSVLEARLPDFTKAAWELVAKVMPILPEDVACRLQDYGYDGADLPPEVLVDVDRIHVWIKSACKIRIRYQDSGGSDSTRIIWPVDLATSWDSHMLSAWCELRKDFRQFRTERILAAEFLDEAVDCGADELRLRWREYQAKLKGVRPDAVKTGRSTAKKLK